MLLRLNLPTVILGAILSLNAQPGFAQFGDVVYTDPALNIGFKLEPISWDPAYVDLPVDDVLGIYGTTTKYSVDLISNGRLVTVHVNTTPSFFYSPISSASAQIFHRTLDLTMLQSSDYGVTLRDVWTHPRFSTVDYYATSRTVLDFWRTSYARFTGVDSLLWGGFGDPYGAFFGSFLLVDFGDPSPLPRTYSLLEAPISGDCSGMTPMRLGTSSCGNRGVLDLLDEMFPYGAINIDDACKDSTRPDQYRSRTRIVHCTSGWWN